MVNNTTKSMIGAEYPSSPSNLVTAALANNAASENLITPEKIKSLGVDDLVSLNSEIFSLSLVLCAYLNGELNPLDLPRKDMVNAHAALKLLAGKAAKTDEDFLNAFQKAVHVWPEIIETDYRYTEKTVKQTEKQTSQEGANKPIEITNSLIEGHILDSMDAAELMTVIVHYAFGISNRAKKLFDVEL